MVDGEVGRELYNDIILAYNKALERNANEAMLSRLAEQLKKINNTFSWKEYSNSFSNFVDKYLESFVAVRRGSDVYVSLKEKKIFPIKNISKPIVKPLEKPADRPVPKAVELPVERPVPTPVERPVELPVERLIQKSLEKTVEKPVEVYHEEAVTSSGRHDSIVSEDLVDFIPEDDLLDCCEDESLRSILVHILTCFLILFKSTYSNLCKNSLLLLT
jgi:hypothetical protein